MHTFLIVTRVVMAAWWILAVLGGVLWIVWRHVLLQLVARRHFAARRNGDRS